jgi:N-acyl-L-homoserine lactone synthetase
LLLPDLVATASSERSDIIRQLPLGTDRIMRTIAVTWETAHLHGEAWISHHRLRYRMFVERQRWDIPNYRKLEYDEFDTPAATYILALDDKGQALGAARLIPTTRPYMVRSLWPHLVDGELPDSDSVWEASRFGCDRDLEVFTRRRVVAQLILGCQEFGLAHGIGRYLGVMPVWIFKRVIAANGCPLTYLGPSLRLQDHEIAAAYIEVSGSALEAARNRTGVHHAVLTQYPLHSRASDSHPNVPSYHQVVPLDPVEINPLATSPENPERELRRFVPVNSTSAPVS